LAHPATACGDGDSLPGLNAGPACGVLEQLSDVTPHIFDMTRGEFLSNLV